MLSRYRGWLAVGLLALVGCSVPVSGNPTGPTGATNTPISTTAAAGIDARTLDPCTAFTEEQIDELGVAEPTPQQNTDGGTLGCAWRHYYSEPIGAYYVDASATIDISSVRPYPPAAQRFKVGPFDAITVAGRTSNRESGCQIAISVMPGQALQVAYAYTGTHPMTQATACDIARPAAEMAVQTLLSRGGR